MAGRPQTRTTFRDDTVSAFQSGVSKFAVQVVTERGKFAEPKEIRNEQQFIREFGQVTHPTAEEAVRAVRQGAILIVNPLHKLTDDGDVPIGTKASAVITVGLGTLTVTAEEVGAGYNGIVISFSKPQSRNPLLLDMTISKPNEFSQTISDVPISLTAEKVIELNEKLGHVSLAISATLTLTESTTGTLASGVKDASAILPIDVIACLNAAYQDYDFGTVFHLVNLYYADVEVDAAFVALAEKHRLSAHLPLPLNASVADMIAQREGTGSFSHTPIDSFKVEYIAGQITVRSIQDNTRKIEIHGMSEIMAAIARKDVEGVWLSSSASRFGKFASDVLDARKFTNDELDELSDAGINFISRISGQGIKRNGNNSLFRDRTKSVSSKSVGDLTLYNLRWTEKLGNDFIDEPADIPTFKAIHRAALPTIKDLIARRAIEPNYLWVGEQDATQKIDEQLQINNVADLALGKYNIDFYITPINALQDIRITTVNTLSVGSSATAVV